MASLQAWQECFEDLDTGGGLKLIKLEQIDETDFSLQSSMRFTGNPGVDELPPEALTLRPADLGPEARTNLTSVPAAMTWFVGPYGVHTPAALLHDRLIGETAIPGVSDRDADSFFRYMLEALGVHFLQRWLMWSAVAFGTRWRAGGKARALVVVWLVLSAAAQATAVIAIIQQTWWLLGLMATGPIPASLLWGKQFRAAILAAYCAPWLLPPTLFGAVGFTIYGALESALSLVISDERSGEGPVQYTGF
jgi:Protein of unknown function (DUF1353)